MAELKTPVKTSSSAASARTATLALIPAAVAFNFAVATLVRTLKLPIYLDCIGGIVTTLISGVWPGVAVAGLSQIVGTITAPDFILYIGTAVAMGLYAHVVGKLSGFKTYGRAVVYGIGMGVLSAMVSFGITAYKGGVTTAGSSFVTLFYLHRGFALVPATILSGLTCDPIDKIAECVVAVWLIRSVPIDLLARFRGGTLDRNFGVPSTAPSSSKDVPLMIGGGMLGLAAAVCVSFFYNAGSPMKWSFADYLLKILPRCLSPGATTETIGANPTTVIVSAVVFAAVGSVVGALAGSALFTLLGKNSRQS
jgi:energy-coupling factor transport system substrate-specific component